MADWYEERIEEPLRDLVRELRNNGFNTECSCGHERYVQMQCLDTGEVGRLDRFLFLLGLRDYVVELHLTRDEGHLRSSVYLKLPDSFDGRVDGSHEGEVVGRADLVMAVTRQGGGEPGRGK